MLHNTQKLTPCTVHGANGHASGIANPSRRRFLASSAFVGGAGLFGVSCSPNKPGLAIGADGSFPEYLLAKPESVIYTTCLQCHVDCQVKAKHWDGVLAKLTSNPYSPQNYLPHLPYETDLARSAKADGKLCAKGQAGIQTYADPYRLRKVLKRAGPRGSNKWQTIEFDQFVKEVAAGGSLFKDIGDDNHYPGFEEVYALRDRAVAKAMAVDSKKVGKGEMPLDEFKSKHAEQQGAARTRSCSPTRCSRMFASAIRWVVAHRFMIHMLRSRLCKSLAPAMSCGPCPQCCFRSDHRCVPARCVRGEPLCRIHSAEPCAISGCRSRRHATCAASTADRSCTPISHLTCSHPERSSRSSAISSTATG